MAPVIALEGVSKSFGSRQILHDVSLAIEPGEIVGLLGPNGSGKTTTLRLMAGYYAPDAGRVTICGRPHTGNRGTRAVGYLPERVPLHDGLTVRHYLRFVADVKMPEPATARRAAVERAMAGFDLEGLADRPLGRLSKGQRQRVGLAQAVLADPPALLLDESTNGLDPVQIVEARAMIRRCAQGRAVVFSSHLMQEIEALCTRIVILRDGRLIDDASLHAGRGALTLRLALPHDRHEALRTALAASPGVDRIDVASIDAGRSEWRLHWSASPPSDTCDAALRTVLSHAQVVAVLAGEPAVEARLLAALALASNAPDIRRRA